MNKSLLLLIAIAVSLLGAQTPAIADDNPVLSDKQVADLLLSPDRDDHRRGVKYVFDNKPNLTSQISRLIGGLSSDNPLIASACDIGLSNGSWDPKVIEEHIPQLIELLSDDSAAARRGAYTALNRIASSLRDRVPKLIAKAAQDPKAMNLILAISKKIGLNNRQWIEAWLPLATSENSNIRNRCRYEIKSVRRSSRILIQLIETNQPDSVVVAILETLASYRQKPKGTGKLVIQMLGHRSSKVRAAAIVSLDEIPHDWGSTRPTLLEIARTENEELRAAAVRRLFRDPGLRKTQNERDSIERQVVRIIDDAFTDCSSVVRRAACSAATRTMPPSLGNRQFAGKLIDRLADSDNDVRVAAQAAAAGLICYALFVLDHDPAKVKKHYQDWVREQSDSSEQAEAQLNQIFADFRKVLAEQRVFLRFIETTAENHTLQTIRDFLRLYLSDDMREQIWQSVPESVRLEESKN